MNPVDKLLFFWTVLEIFPAEGTTNVVRKTCELLAAEVSPGLVRTAINTRLKLGRIYRERGYIVHDGKAFVPIEEEEHSQTMLIDSKLRLPRASGFS